MTAPRHRARPRPRRAAVRAALTALTLSAASGCDRRAPAVHRRVVEPAADAPAPRFDETRRCALRASPPTPIADVEALAGVSVAWSGTHFGVVWGDTVDGERLVRFARVASNGALLGSPLRLSETHTQAADPAITWNGTSWVVVWSGGLREPEDIYQGRVDARGTAAGRPWRMTRERRRTDLQPRIESTAQGFGLAWVSRTSVGRWRLYAQALDAFDAPKAFPAMLLETGVSLAETGLVWTGSQWGVSALGVQQEVLRVEFARMDARGYTLGSLNRLTPQSIGGIDPRGRYAIAWDGAGFAIAWSEVTAGASHVFFRRATARGNLVGDTLDLREEGESADTPALASAGEGSVAAAWLVSQEGRARLRVRTLDANSRLQEGRVEVQDHDGSAGRPVVTVGGDTLALISAASRSLTLHRVTLGPCPIRGY